MIARLHPSIAPSPRGPIRVGFVVHVMQVAGAEVLVRETIRQLGDAIVPTIFCLDRVGQIGEELVAEGVDLVCLKRRPGWDFKVSRRLAKEANKRKIEILHAHQYTPFFYSALAKPLIRSTPKLILTEHGRHYPDTVSPKRRAINRLVFDHLADRVNACCDFSAQALNRVDGFAGNRIEVIPNGIAIDRYTTPPDKLKLRQELGLPTDRRIVVHVARHHPVKDQAMLLNGFALMAKQCNDVDLLMVGDGPLRGTLEEQTYRLNINQRVRFLGVRNDVPDLLRAADIFALTSVSEAASLTLLEAMAAALPVVVTNVGGNPEIVRDGVDGLLVPRGDASACADALRRLLKDSELSERMGEAGRRRVHEMYQLHQTVEHYARLYGDLTGVAN